MHDDLRKAIDDQRRRDLDERAALLQELHHRVRNNAQVFAALLGVQASRAGDPAVQAALRIAATRASTMAVAQQQIWEAGSSARIDLRDIVHRLVRAEAVRDPAAEILVDAPDPAPAPLASAVPFGLIVHELLTNALRHGTAKGEDPRARIRLARTPHHLRTSITDDGPGLPPDLLSRDYGAAGLAIVRSLARQLGAELDLHGTTIGLTFALGPGLT